MVPTFLRFGKERGGLAFLSFFLSLSLFFFFHFFLFLLRLAGWLGLVTRLSKVAVGWSIVANASIVLATARPWMSYVEYVLLSLGVLLLSLFFLWGGLFTADYDWEGLIPWTHRNWSDLLASASALERNLGGRDLLREQSFYETVLKLLHDPACYAFTLTIEPII